MLPALVVLASVASLLFTIRGLIARSWVMLWLAATCSLLVSALGVFSIGGAVFLVTCLQLAAALNMGGEAPQGNGSVFLTSIVSMLLWLALVPFQMYGPAWLGGYSVYVLGGLLGLLAIPLPIVVMRHGHA